VLLRCFTFGRDANSNLNHRLSLVGLVAHEIVSDRKDSNIQHCSSAFRLLGTLINKF
jgi:hypothetical protein